MSIGDAFWIPDEHCWFVLSEPNQDDEVVIANFTTSRPNSDDTCIIRAGEHPDIEHDSVVAFAYARLVSRIRLESQIKNGTFRSTAPLSPQLLARIQQGMLESEFARQKVQSAVRQSLGQG